MSNLKDLYGSLKTKAMPALDYIKANPEVSATLGMSGVANLAGLFDNNKIGGQLGGLAGTGALIHHIAPTLDPQTQIAIALTGGGLGALFDKIRAMKEQQSQYANQMNTGRY